MIKLPILVDLVVAAREAEKAIAPWLEIQPDDGLGPDEFFGVETTPQELEAFATARGMLLSALDGVTQAAAKLGILDQLELEESLAKGRARGQAPTHERRPRR